MRSLIIRLPESIKPSDRLRVEDGSPIIFAINDTDVAKMPLGILEQFEELGYLDMPAPHSPSSN
jgi:hypothetical protein